MRLESSPSAQSIQGSVWSMKKRGRRTGKDWKIEKNEKKKTDRGFTTTRHPYYPLSIQASSPPSHHSDWPLHQPRRQNPHNNPSFPSSPITEPSPPPGRRCGEILLDILTEDWGSLPSLHSHPSNPGCTHVRLPLLPLLYFSAPRHGPIQYGSITLQSGF